MDRRDALRAVAGLAITSAVAGCDAPTGTPIQSKSPPAVQTSKPTPAVTRPALPDEVTNGPPDRDQVALTFHGQGDPAVVGRLLDELAKGGAWVTVLAVGTWLIAEPRLAHRVLDAGHELGNHTQHHADIKRMSPARMHAEIDVCAQTLRTLTGSIGRWFRPSQTPHATPAIKAAATAVGYPTCLSYDVDSLDYTDPGTAAIVRTTLSAVRPGSVVSLHFGHAGTVDAIAPLLTGLRRRGLTPVTMTELMA